MGKSMNIIKKLIARIIPEYAMIPLLTVVVVNCFSYWGGMLINHSMYHHDMSNVIDAKIPFVPQMTFFYVGSYVFWIFYYIYISRIGKEHCIRFCLAEITAKLICFVCFIVFPTTIKRPLIVGTSFWEEVLCDIYERDPANNLFPSIHCLVSWFCYIGVRGKKEVPIYLRIFALVFALCVCLSTVTVKQHVIIDGVVAIALCEISYYIYNKVSLPKFLRERYVTNNEKKAE